jgi:hypothetical protein
VSVVEAHDVTAGQSLTLVATGTDPDGDPITYAWKQVSGPPVGTLEGATPSFDVPDEIVTLRFEVVASDGKVATTPAGIIVRVFEDHTRAVFVAATGSDDNTRAAPFRTIQKAIDSVGFLSIDGFQIRSADATDATPSSVGVRVSNARSVILAHNLIEAGAGAQGTAAVQPAQTATGANGKPGMAGGGCATTRVGGTGGTSPIGSAGGRGGNGGLGGGFAGTKGNGPGAGAGGAAAGAFAPGKSGGYAVFSGPSGTNGIGGGELGVLLGYDYRPVPGSPGQPGVRGGGGGGGSGGAGNLVGFCGGGGRGGGAGGTGDLGGPGGSGGGGSFGVIVALESTGIIIRDNIVRAGARAEPVPAVAWADMAAREAPEAREPTCSRMTVARVAWAGTGASGGMAAVAAADPASGSWNRRPRRPCGSAIRSPPVPEGPEALGKAPGALAATPASLADRSPI